MLDVSDTAYAIATVRALEAGRPAAERLFADPYAPLFRDAGAHVAEATARLLGLAFAVEGVRLRTRFTDDLLRERLAAGLKQVVLLGAGFDARGLRMPEIASSGARVYEVDFPGLLDHKRRLLAGGGVSLPDHVAYCPADFRDPDFETALRLRLEASGFRLGAEAVFVWEGIVAYVDDAAIDRTLGFIVHAAGPGTRMVFDYIDARFVPTPVEERFRRAGFARFESTAHDDLWRRHLPGEPHPAASVLRMGVATIE